jgi:hypothetical protein
MCSECALNAQQMKIAVFSTRKYDRQFFEQANAITMS